MQYCILSSSCYSVLFDVTFIVGWLKAYTVLTLSRKINISGISLA